MIVARFELECKACERTVAEGEKIGLVDGLWCCEDCVKEHGEDDDEQA
jgi:ribosomal protein L37AE/L43A